MNRLFHIEHTTYLGARGLLQATAIRWEPKVFLDPKSVDRQNALSVFSTRRINWQHNNGVSLNQALCLTSQPKLSTWLIQPILFPRWKVKYRMT